MFHESAGKNGGYILLRQSIRPWSDSAYSASRFWRDVDCVIGSIVQVFYLVLEWREPSGLAMDGSNFARFSVRIGKLEMPVREVNHYTSRVSVHGGLLMRPVVDVQHLHMLILKIQLVMSRRHLDWILSDAGTGSQQARQQQPREYFGKHLPPPGIPAYPIYAIVPQKTSALSSSG
jgi:hypothetical protein